MEPNLTNILDPMRQVQDMDAIMQEVEDAKLAAALERMANERRNRPQPQPKRTVVNRTPQERAQVPVSSDSYTIQRGDTLWDISKRTGISIEELARYNGIRDPNSIRAGAKLFIPQRAESISSPLQAPVTPPRTPAMQMPRQAPQMPPQAPQGAANGPGMMGLGGLVRKMGQQVDPTVLGAMAGMGGAGGMAGMLGGRQAMGSALRPNPARMGNSAMYPNPARGAMNSAMYPNPARMNRMIEGGTQNSTTTLDDLYRMFGQ